MSIPLVEVSCITTVPTSGRLFVCVGENTES